MSAEPLETIIDSVKEALEANLFVGDLSLALQKLQQIVALRSAITDEDDSIMLDWIDDIAMVVPVVEQLQQLDDEAIARQGRELVDEAKRLWARPGRPRMIAILVMQRTLATMARWWALSRDRSEQQKALALCKEAISLQQYWGKKDNIAPIQELASELEKKLA